MAGPYLKVSARKWIVDCSTDGGVTYINIKGLTKFAFGRSSTRTDTTDFTADGIETGEIMARGAHMKVEGFFLEAADKTRDPGQAALETFADLVGTASVTYMRLTSPSGTIYKFQATVEIGDYSGGNNDKSAFSATLTRTGALTIT